MRIAKINDMSKTTKFVKMDNHEYNYSHLFCNMCDGICIINEYGYVEYVNSAYEKIFHVDRNDLVGKSIFMTQNDDIILTSFREKRAVRGKLKYFNGNSQISASTTVIDQNKSFFGVIAMYSKCHADTKGNMIKISTNRVVSDKERQYKFDGAFNDIIGESEVFKKVMYRAQKASKTSSTVLVRGESGTGKELIAKAIHKNSKRWGEPFITINCGAIPSNLLESELFGHEQGSFTGAVKRKIGKFEQAGKGTIFLDEVGDLPLDMQVKLLRVLQEKEFVRVGGNQTIEVGARIIAATNRNLEEMVERQEYREDLYYRLNVIPLYLPALRERKKDLPLLINHFIDKLSKKIGIHSITFTKEAKKCLCNYDWPGNIRELENIIEQLIVLSDDNTIDIDDIPGRISRFYDVNRPSVQSSSLINLKVNGDLATMEDYEREIIRHAIKRFGSFNAAGKALGVTHKTVATKARKYNLV
ncbi:sigma 54-interacting transcriptional regulator [Wukongibacter baidiensis]|uniref:sigma-54 interaction domain-containing protein n=1 Tax=Wukongibacter baidiensis TaxID=1723361 RepID=UPI003D7F87A0